jgi:hypothetical protein
MEQRITDYLHRDLEPLVATVAQSMVVPGAPRRQVPVAEYEWLKRQQR